MNTFTVWIAQRHSGGTQYAAGWNCKHSARKKGISDHDWGS